MPNPKVAPVSRARRPTTSSSRDSRMSAAFRKIRWRSAGMLCDHAGKAGGDVRDDVARERIAILERSPAVRGRPLAADEVLVLANLGLDARHLSLLSKRAASSLWWRFAYITPRARHVSNHRSAVPHSRIASP